MKLSEAQRRKEQYITMIISSLSIRLRKWKEMERKGSETFDKREREREGHSSGRKVVGKAKLKEII